MDIAYIYTWNRNEPMRFFYKINARMMVPVILPSDKLSTTLTDVTTEPILSPLPNMETTPLPPQINMSGLNPIVETIEEDKKKTVPQLLKLPIGEESKVIEGEQLHKTESNVKEPTIVIARTDVSNKDRRSSSPSPIESLNPPISPEGSSRKENVSDNVRNNCANELSKSNPTQTMATEEEKSVDLVEHQQTGNTTAEIPMKKLEKLVDQQQMLPIAVTSNSPPSALPLPKKHKSVGESKLNLSITKLIMKNKNASAATKFVPTLQQMQQIGMHTSIPSFQQQQQQPQPSSLQPNAYVRPGFPGMHPFKRTQEAAPVRSQASTNRPPFIPVRKSYEWNKARSLAAKPLPSPVTNSVKDNKMNEKLPMTVGENPTKKPMADKPPTTVVSQSMLSKNSDEMNAAQSLLKVGQDLRLLKPSTVTDLHDKYNCESSLQITKVTEPETNQLPAAHENHSNSQPSLQIMRVPPATDKLPKPAVTTETSNGNNSVNAVVVPSKPVNKKPVPSLYSMPTKRTKEDSNVQNNNVTDNNRIERRVDTENGVLSVSLLTETSKQDMDAKRREIVQPDVSIKLMTFATESVKKTPELSPIASGGCNGKKKLDESNPITSGGANNKNKLDELSPMVGSGANKRKLDELSPMVGSGANKRKLDELNPIVGSNANNKRKLEELNPIAGSGVNKRKQVDPERKVTPPRLGLNKDDVPQLIEINSSPYAKLLPAKKQQSTPKQQQASKHQPVTKQHSVMKQQPTSKLQPATKVLDLSKSPPNGCVKRLAATEVSGNCSLPNTKKSTSSAQMVQPSITTATPAAINSNVLFAAQRQAAAFLLKQHFESLNNGLMRNGGKGPIEWPRAMFNPALFARPPTNLNN